MSWTIRGDADATLFTLAASSPGTWANSVQVTVTTGVAPASPPGNPPATIEIVLGRLKETYTATTAAALVRDINDGSRLVRASGLAAADNDKAVRSVVAATGAGLGGPDGVAVTSSEITDGLALLSSETVNIVAIGGLDAKVAGAAVLSHLESTENDGRERVAVLGVQGDDLTKIADDASRIGNARAILVAPGIVADDASRVGEANKAVKLPAPYAAALVAGRLATLAPHISLTNKDVASDGLTRRYTRAEQKQLLTNRILVLQENLGIRVLKGITTDNGPFRQISVRRIVDYAKAGVRIGSNPYIGRLNNARVRAALQATLDGFLSSMVLDEMLISYTLAVTATRAQEIAGTALVTMTLRPTFSIDFIKVIMNLE
jgi:hypothetical protein